MVAIVPASDSRKSRVEIPSWKAALALDRELPVATRGALVSVPVYFQINYLLYPRLLYPAAPDTPP